MGMSPERFPGFPGVPAGQRGGFDQHMTSSPNGVYQPGAVEPIVKTGHNAGAGERTAQMCPWGAEQLNSEEYPPSSWATTKQSRCESMKRASAQAVAAGHAQSGQHLEELNTVVRRRFTQGTYT